MHGVASRESNHGLLLLRRLDIAEADTLYFFGHDATLGKAKLSALLFEKEKEQTCSRFRMVGRYTFLIGLLSATLYACSVALSAINVPSILGA